MSLIGKKIVLAVTGSIAAYKTPQLVRLLIKAGATVRVIMTRAAADMVTPLALSTVSKNAVLMDVNDGANWNNHVEMGLWADAMLVAPCTANTLAKLAYGLCDNLVTAVYLSARCPVFVAPAMDEDMWHHPTTQKNIGILNEMGHKLVPVAFGELASGLVGEGRMAEPEEIVSYLADALNPSQPLTGVKSLVTAGPTFERLDPVRFIGNFSSGKMGIAIAEALAMAGSEVTLVLGPTQNRPKNSAIKVVQVESATEMRNACLDVFALVGIAVMAAAVADFAPAAKSQEKIKKTGEDLTIHLIKTPDILASLGEIKKPTQTLIGFALETENELENANRKLASKNADAIALNSLKDEGVAFGSDKNKITLLFKNGKKKDFPLMGKAALAGELVKEFIGIYHGEKNI